jgi:bisphosphoglycerate-independent phosphoglycerate mutase (AlkP superfamily)
MQLFPPQPIRESCSDDANVIFGHGCKRIKIADTNSFDHITCLMRSIPISPRTNSILLSLLETAMVNLYLFAIYLIPFVKQLPALWAYVAF